MKSLKLIVVGVLVAASISGFAQTPVSKRVTFDVASIKPSMPGIRESMSNQPNRLLVNNLTLRQLIGFAYRLRDGQLDGGPDWIAADQWDIEARTAEGANTADTIPLRLQSLLEDRFQLKIHHETRDIPVYALTISKGGLKLTAVDPPPPSGPNPAPAPPSPPVGLRGELPKDFMPRPGAIMAGPGLVLASAVTMGEIANVLRGRVGRPVLDKTNINGYFNLRLQFAVETGATSPDTANAPAGPSIFTAIQEQLGLKLEAEKAPLDVLVIDSVQRPSAN